MRGAIIKFKLFIKKGNLTTFILLILMGFGTACNSNDKYSIVTEHLNNGFSSPILSGMEVMLKSPSHLWTEREIEALEQGKDSTILGTDKLKSGAKVLVIDVGDTFVLIRTLLGREGFIRKDKISPIMPHNADAVKYYVDREIRAITTHVKGLKFKSVNLWRNIDSREMLIESLSHGSEVAIVELRGDYVKLATINGNEGWCRKQFLAG